MYGIINNGKKKSKIRIVIIKIGMLMI